MCVRKSELGNKRDGASSALLFPSERDSTLDKNILEKLGLDQSKIRINEGSEEPDALWFLQLILPMCDPTKSGIENDPRVGYYDTVTNYSNLYRCQKGIGSTYGHTIKEAVMPEYVHFDGVLVRDGVLGGGDGALYRRWQKDSSGFDRKIQDYSYI